jgi:hypothetical protein
LTSIILLSELWVLPNRRISFFWRIFS